VAGSSMACKGSGVQIPSAAAGQWLVEDREGVAASSQVAGMPQVMRVAPTKMRKADPGLYALRTRCRLVDSGAWFMGCSSLAPAAPWSCCRRR
jgi:hypothetical protein